jgi:hypothetical protein
MFVGSQEPQHQKGTDEAFLSTNEKGYNFYIQKIWKILYNSCASSIKYVISFPEQRSQVSSRRG